MSTINVSVQLAVPAWVQARALGTYMMTFQGGMAWALFCGELSPNARPLLSPLRVLPAAC